MNEVIRICGDDPVVTSCGEGGPLLVRHATAVVTDDDREHVVSRPVVAICTCRRSQRFPWCDSTHKSVRRTS